MSKFKPSPLAFIGLSLVIAMIALTTPRTGQGQGGSNQHPLDVEVVNTPTVQVGNTVNNPVLVHEAGTTVLALDFTITLNPNVPFSGARVDVGTFKQIRITAVHSSGFGNYEITPRIVSIAGEIAEFVPLDTLTPGSLGAINKTYDIPGRAIDFVMQAGPNGPSTVELRVYGRTN
jgi:hypothetical protein